MRDGVPPPKKMEVTREWLGSLSLWERAGVRAF
jgi:hypothetical protein